MHISDHPTTRLKWEQYKLQHRLPRRRYKLAAGWRSLPWIFGISLFRLYLYRSSDQGIRHWDSKVEHQASRLQHFTPLPRSLRRLERESRRLLLLWFRNLLAQTWNYLEDRQSRWRKILRLVVEVNCSLGLNSWSNCEHDSATRWMNEVRYEVERVSFIFFSFFFIKFL